MTPEEQLGANIRRHRESLGISQEALAAKARLHRTYIGSIERGERNVAIRNIVKIAHALDCSPADLLSDII